MICGSGTLHSQTAISFGGHYWYANSEFRGEAFENIEINQTSMYGPYLNLRVGRFTLGSSIFFGTFNWEYKDYQVDIDMKRNDLNFSAGFSILPRITLFGAVKVLSFTGEREDSRLGRFDREIKGTMYGGGISGFMPFQRSRFFLFWSAAYLSGTLDDSEELPDADRLPQRYDFEYDYSITALTISLGYSIQPGLALMAGYRADLAGENNEETIQGLIATLAYTVR